MHIFHKLKSKLGTEDISIYSIPILMRKKSCGLKKLYLFGIPILKIINTKNKRLFYWCGVHVYSRPPKVQEGFVHTIPLLTPLLTPLPACPRSFAFQQSTKPLVSIIVPVYNQYEYTLQCLWSIYQHASDIPIEVILADDNSTDETRFIRKRVKNLIISRNSTNLGYIKNCNRAAKQAKGKYLYFLNNDTIVQPNWLRELVDVFTNNPRAGVVGSAVHKPNGLLQECGVFMFKDYFCTTDSKQEPDLSCYNYLRPCDYVSGCSLMTPKKLFEDIGGFDERYSPAYCDDPDYCLSARARGYEIWVQPKSKILHFGNITYGTLSNSLMERNNSLLREKWAAFFQSRVPYQFQKVPFTGQQRPASILIVDDHLPQFDKHAGGKSIFQFIELFLQHNMTVKFCPLFMNQMEQPYYDILTNKGVEIIPGSDLKQYIADYFKELDYLLISRPNVAQELPIKAIKGRGIKVLYYGHDLHHRRMGNERKLYPTTTQFSQEEVDKMELIEKLTIEFCDWAYYPSVLEEKYVKQHFGLKNVSVLPPYLYNPLNMPKHLSFQSSKDLLFVGSTHGPNKLGLLWFLDNVYPAIVQAIPDICLNLVGANPDKKLVAKAKKHIRVLGHLSEKELANLYAHTKITIAPLTYGAGIKGKVVNSLYHSTPVVTTPIGAEGIDLSYGNIHVAATAEEFADKLIHLYTHPECWNASPNGYNQFITQGYSYDKAWQVLRQQIDDGAKDNTHE